MAGKVAIVGILLLLAAQQTERGVAARVAENIAIRARAGRGGDRLRIGCGGSAVDRGADLLGLELVTPPCARR
jgi:hypothetical protein